MKFFVTQVSNFASVGTIKLLKKIKNHPIEIIGCSYFPNGFTSGSMMVDKCYQSPFVKDSNYIEFIIKICNEQKVDCIISADEDELLKLSENKERINCINIVANKTVLMIFKDKLVATEHIERLNIVVPKIINNICQFDKNHRPKIIFRKRISVGSKGIEVVDLEKEQYIKNYFSNDYFIQEYIEGDEYTVDVFCDYEGIPKIIIPRKRLDIRNGISYKCQIVYNKEIINTCKKIYNSYKIPGFSNIQFKYLNGICYFIELNPRFAGTGIASSIASFNIFELYIDCFLLHKELKSLDYYMSFVCWDAIITRHYDENIYIENN